MVGSDAGQPLYKSGGTRKGDRPHPPGTERRSTTLMDMASDETEEVAAFPPPGALPDADIVKRVRAGEPALFEILMRRHNQRLYRAARAIVKDEREVEDVMQQAYFSAFTHLHQFEERSQFSTWLTRIALNEALGRRRRMQALGSMERTSPAVEDRAELIESIASPQADPERQAYVQELHRLLEAVVETLPESYRTVFMLRDVQGLSTSETGEDLGLEEDAVKTRLHRARGMIRRAVVARLGAAAPGLFQFHAPRCDGVVAAVRARIVERSTGCRATQNEQAVG
jgi:RNA polymerase sigma-70 factor, ECF subfamily